MSVLPKVIYKLDANPIKIPRGIFVDMDKLILKYIWKSKGPSIAKQFWKKKKKNQVERLNLPDFKTYYIKL